MKITHCKRVLALLLCALTLMSLLPTAAFAGQVDDYHDPAEHWMTSSNRTNQLDVNSVVTQETIHCFNCGKDVQATVWRVPEYTRDGVTALTRNVKYSDGTTMDGQGTGLVNDGTPGVDATYTGYHWTKSSCNYCSTFNCNHLSEYNYGKNVYELYDCAAEFMDDLDETVTYEFVDSTYHRKTTHGGTYCVFCYGTRPRENSVLERHTLHTDIIPQLGHQRFAIVQHCEDCEYTEYEFVAAKSVVADYYGVVDGQPHTLTVSDLSEAGVSTAIRYGNSADSCTLTSAPNYTEEGQYVVYYEITYTYRNTSMTEDGVAYVWLRDERETNTGCSCGCGRSDCDCRHDGCTGSCCDSCGNDHNWTLMEHISATCTELGYDRYVCLDCGKVEKRDYVNAIGHAYQSVVIRDASCETEGKIMETCRNCGDVKVTLTPKGEHQWRTYNVAATCTGPGYTVRECSVCSEQHIENITDPAGHRYVSHVTAPTCTTGGFTLHVCSACGDSYADSYTEATGHFWDDGTVLREPTCTEDGLIEYRCTVCGVTKLEDYGGSGDAHASHTHTTVVKLPALSVSSTVISNVPPVANTAAALSSSGGTGHTYIGTVTAPTCTERGYTTFTCANCCDSYQDEVTEAKGHRLDEGKVLTPGVCDHDGVIQYFCLDCDYSLLETIPATGHVPGPDATCTDPGVCTVCGKVLSAAAGHDLRKEVIPATCLDLGHTHYYCADCDLAYDSDYTLPLGHAYIAVVTAPTCLDAGYTTYTCSRCDDSYVTDHIAALGHEWDAGTQIVSTSCNGGGAVQHTCLRCGEQYLEALSPDGHTPGPVASCTEPQLCAVCGAVLAQAAGHDVKDGP